MKSRRLRSSNLRRSATVALACLALSASAAASFIDYRFSVNKALVHGTESIGGPADPIQFQFRVDRDAINLSGSPLDGLYPIGGDGFGGYGSVTVAGITAVLQGGAFGVADAPWQDTIGGTVGGYDDGSRIGGRSLFVADAHLWDFSGRMIDGLGLPMSDNFKAFVTGGAFVLFFRAAPTDPEFLTGNYVKFDTFILPNDLTVTVSLVPEPATLALVSAALLGVAVTRRRNPKTATC